MKSINVICFLLIYGLCGSVGHIVIHIRYYGFKKSRFSIFLVLVDLMYLLIVKQIMIYYSMSGNSLGLSAV